MKPKYFLIKLRNEKEFISYSEVFDDYIERYVVGEDSYFLTDHGYYWIEEKKLIVVDFTYTRENWDRLKQYTFYRHFIEFYLTDKWNMKFKELIK